jgi:acetolactate synthase I/II/III large subunit
MATTAEVLARTLREAGVTRMFGLPGGEILDFMEAARQAGIEFLLTRHEAAASFMADVTGQITRAPAVCVSTLGPGAVNMTLGVANAFLDRSPVIAITATLARKAVPYATHQDLDLNAVYRPFTKMAITLDGEDTAQKVHTALDTAAAPRMGPVHIAVPSDIARTEEKEKTTPGVVFAFPGKRLPVSFSVTDIAHRIAGSRRPVVVIGLDVNPHTDVAAVRAFVDALGVPVFTTPKAKGIVPEDHALFYGVCAGVSADAVILEWFERADLLVGIGFEPVESDKLWHQTMPLVSLGPVSIAAREFRPQAEATGDLTALLPTLLKELPHERAFDWSADDHRQFRQQLESVLRPPATLRGLSGFQLTRRLRDLFPRDTIFTTDVGSVKMVTSQAWPAYEPLTFFESNGLSAMSYSLPAAMAARLQFPDRPILCAIGDGGFGMTIAEIETCVRERLHFVTVVYNDSSLSLIDAAQVRRGYPTLGVRYGEIDFAAAAAAMGAWTRRVHTLDDLDRAVQDALKVDRPVVIDAVVDPAEYHAHTKPRS